MSEYDSILKEKKKYVEPEPLVVKKKKKFPWLKIDIFCVFIILVVSYLVYCHTILTADKVFLSDFSQLMDKYEILFKHFYLDKLDTSYQMEGTIQFEDMVYNYGVIQDDEKLKIDLSHQDQYLFYYLDSGNRYVQLSNFIDYYIELDGENYFQVFRELKTNFLNYVSKDQYIRKFYLDGTVPVVESDLVLKSDDVKQILGLSSMNSSYEVLFTFKNHALTNEIISMKMVVNDLNTKKRYVITYQDGELVYSDGENSNWKFVLTQKQDDFTLKIYQNDIMYSVLSGESKENTYQYMYQVIDRIYNIVLNIQKEKDGYLYEFTSTIEKNDITKKRSVQATLHYQEDVILENDTQDRIKYQTLSLEEQERYKLELENMIGYLRQFIEEYK